MRRIILSVNSGSSSVKISAYTVDGGGAEPKQIAEAQVSGLTAPPARLTYKRGSEVVLSGKEQQQQSVKNQDAAFRLILDTLVADEELDVIGSRSDISVAAHRIVHGGDYQEAKMITPGTYHHIEKLIDLAPLHNGPSLTIVDSCMRELPAARNLACFDTQFHATIPPHISTYPINQEIARKNGLRKYGFHGLSYAFITGAVSRFVGRPAADLNIIAMHLGSGASVCAVRAGASHDTTMGLTPLAGLPGATRSGSVDPSLVFHYVSDAGKLSPASTAKLHISRAEEILNKESGWAALTGTTDFARVSCCDTPERELAFDMFANRILNYIGSYFVLLGGNVDALVFAGGIGERSAKLRARICRQIGMLNFAIDHHANENLHFTSDSPVVDISAADSGHRVLVCSTDEQLEMARMAAKNDELWED